jgi:hypothetical protein
LREGKGMKLIKSIGLLKKYSVCPECGNEHIGNGEGTLEIEENLFRRTCKCGWIVEIRDFPDESTVYGNDCPTGKCEM